MGEPRQKVLVTLAEYATQTGYSVARLGELCGVYRVAFEVQLPGEGRYHKGRKRLYDRGVLGAMLITHHKKNIRKKKVHQLKELPDWIIQQTFDDLGV